MMYLGPVPLICSRNAPAAGSYDRTTMTGGSVRVFMAPGVGVRGKAVMIVEPSGRRPSEIPGSWTP